MRRKPGVVEKAVHKFIYLSQLTLNKESKRYIKQMKSMNQMSESGAIPMAEVKAYYKGYKDGLSFAQHMLHKINTEFAAVMKEKDVPVDVPSSEVISGSDIKMKEIKFNIKMDFQFPTIYDKGACLEYLLNNDMTSSLLKDHRMRLVLSPYSYKEFPLRPVITASTVFNTVNLEHAIGIIKEIDLQRCIIKVYVLKEAVEKFFDGKLVANEWEAHMRVVMAGYKQTVGELPVLEHGGKLLCFDLVKKEK